MFENLTNDERLSMLSGLLILGSNIPYALRIWQGKINPSITTWILYTAIGFTMLTTFDSAFYEGEEIGEKLTEEIFVISGFLDSLIILILISKKQNKQKVPFPTKEKALMISVFIVLIIWLFLKNYQELIIYTYFLAILLEILASEPQLTKNFRKPKEDRPIPWLIYSVGYILPATFLENIAQVIMPVIMSTIYVFMALPLIHYRIKNKIPFKDWI